VFLQPTIITFTLSTKKIKEEINTLMSNQKEEEVYLTFCDFKIGHYGILFVLAQVGNYHKERS